MFESRHHGLAPRGLFYRRVLRNTLIALTMIVVSLASGMAGYRYFEHLSWLDALLNASMILSSMGPVQSPQTDGGKLFATLYALFSGVWFLTVAGVLFAPVAHRILHKFHLEIQPEEKKKSARRPRKNSS